MSANEARYLAQLESTVASLERQVTEARREMEERQTDRAAEARSGRMGRDWQAVQARIDAGRTTLADVFGGRDDSPEAARLLELSRRNLARLAEADPPEEVREELAAAEQQRRAVAREPVRLTDTDETPR